MKTQPEISSAIDTLTRSAHRLDNAGKLVQLVQTLAIRCALKWVLASGDYDEEAFAEYLQKVDTENYDKSIKAKTN